MLSCNAFIPVKMKQSKPFPPLNTYSQNVLEEFKHYQMDGL